MVFWAGPAGATEKAFEGSGMQPCGRGLLGTLLSGSRESGDPALAGMTVTPGPCDRGAGR